MKARWPLQSTLPNTGTPGRGARQQRLLSLPLGPRSAGTSLPGAHRAQRPRPGFAVGCGGGGRPPVSPGRRVPSGPKPASPDGTSVPETPAPSRELGSAARGRRADLNFAGNEAAGTASPCAPCLLGAPRVGLPESVTSLSEPSHRRMCPTR